MTAIEHRLEGMDDTRRALLEAIQARQRGPRPAPDRGPTPGQPGDDVPASFAQRRLWFVDQLHRGNTAYNVPLALRMRGRLDTAALEQAIRGVVDRHEILRTTYIEQAEQVRPVVNANDLRLEVRPMDGDLEEQLHHETAKGFDLAAELPIRAVLHTVGTDDHVLQLVIHHIAIDGWSVRILYDELGTLYGSARHGVASPLEEVSLQYGDVARWQQRRLQGDRLVELRRFWRSELADVQALDLPTDRPRPPVFDHDGEVCFVDFPTPLVNRLRDYAKHQGVSLYMTLLAGFAVTLSRYTGQSDITLGSAVSGREHPLVAELIGFFVNTVATRVRLDTDPTFDALVTEVRRRSLAVAAHQEMPFDLLVDDLAIARDPSRPPLTPVMFLLDETAEEGPALAGIETTALDLAARASKYDLMVNLHDTGTGLRAMVEYPVALFDADTVQQLMGHFTTLLDHAMAAPHLPISHLDVLSAADRRRILDDCNDTERDLGVAPGTCLHQLVEHQVDTRPDGVAMLQGGTDSGWPITYADLERRANALAHHLVGRGAGPDRLVGVCLGRGPDVVVAILAILKAGSGYVPLDPGYPPGRLSRMLDDADPVAVVTCSRLQSRLQGCGIPLVRLDSDRAVLAAAPGARPCTAVTDSDLGYVIFTSGSTGRPKGIALEHRGVVNNLLDLNTAHGIGPGDAVLALSSTSFDMSVYETLGMLAAGGTIVFADPQESRDPTHWAQLIERYGVTVWNSAPAVLELLLDQLDHDPADVGSLRVAFLGGDWIPVTQPDRLRRHSPDLRFIAMGGATEASIHSTLTEVGRVDPGWTAIPYGRPMANQRCYVLDPLGRPVPPGVHGELHLAGVGLARGYHGEPDRTARSFPVIHLGPGRLERTFRTGDVASIDRDGVIHLHGRRDFRIKLNGLRIDPGEVEQAMRRHPQVDAAVAILVQSADVAPRLVGCVTTVSDDPPTSQELRRIVSDAVPPFAVPSRFVVLDALPLTPNGKVDRLALAAAVAEGAASVSDGVPSGAIDPTVTRIQAVFATILGTVVGPDDDFFLSGGDSFAAVAAVRAIDPTLRVVELFSHATPAAIARRLHERSRAGDAGDHRWLHRLKVGEQHALTLVCIPHGGGDAIVYRPLADALPAQLTLTAVSPPGHDPMIHGDLASLEEWTAGAAEAIAEEVHGPFAVYGHCAGTVAALEITRHLEQRGHRPVGLILGAALPEEDPDWSLDMERELTDEALVQYLGSLGGFDGVLSEADLGGVIRLVRHDMREAARFFQRCRHAPPPPITTPTTCIFGDADDATAGYPQRVAEWGRFATSVQHLTIPGGGHYFAKHLPDQLAELLRSLLITPSTTDSHGGPHE